MQSNLTSQNYMQRKLDHYNAWLLDPKRPFGVPYGGFPEDKQKEAGIKALQTEYVAKAEAKKKVAASKPRAIRARKSSGPTKQDRAIELYKANIKLSKDNMIEILRTELDMSLAGATTYYYNAKRLAV